jgi:phospholipase/carboxylesterase
VHTPSLVERVVAARTVEAGRRPPLLVLLHGIGADENDLLALVSVFDPRFTVVSVRAPHPWYGGFAWFRIDLQPGGRMIPDRAQATQALADLIRWVETAPARHGTDPARTFLCGFSQGAMMTLGVLGATPERLAGVVALSGRAAADLFPTRAPRDAIAPVPLFVAHGTFDDVLPLANGRAVRAAFEGLSKDLTYREYPVAHGITDDEARAVAEWLRERL